jgi:hypothetical protein
MNEGVFPSVDKEILRSLLPIVRPVLDGPGRERASDRFEKLEGNQIEARLAVLAFYSASKTCSNVCGLRAFTRPIFQAGRR